MDKQPHSELKETAVAYQTTTEFPALHDPRYPVYHIGRDLEPYIRLIVQKFHPLRVILFGSQAYGEPTEHSDVDLLIVRPGIAAERESNIELRKAFREIPGRRNFSFTLLSKTPERIEERLAVKSPFYEEIVGKGIELYAE